MSRMSICVATMRPNPNVDGSIQRYPGDICLATSNAITYPAVHVQYNTPENNLGVIGSYQKLYEQSTEEILCFMHDDCIVRERGWDERVLKEFEDPSVGVVGFGGALRHGHPDLYRAPYKLQNLARYFYRSNTDDAEVHGERFTGSCEVAVIDGFAIVVRRSLLDRCGGWPVVDLFFHSYDYYICCMAHRYGYKVRLAGIRCNHRGGQTSLSREYQEWARKNSTSDAEIHKNSHEYIYREFKDVLPYRCHE